MTDGPIGDPSEAGSDRQPENLSPKERRLERLRTWRDANRQHLRDYQRRWRAEHPDRIKIHRRHEYAARRRERRRQRLRREAQRRRRALKRLAAQRQWE